MKTAPILSAGIVSLLLLAPSYAATFTWDGGGADVLWNTAGNWNPDGAPPDNGTADIVMAGSVRLINSVNAADGNWNILSLSFATGAGNFVVGGSNSLTIGSGGITNNDNSTQQVSNDVVIAASQVWATNGGGNLSVVGAVNNNGNLLTVNAASGNISIDDAISGAGGLVKNGPDALNFSGGINSYTGTTTVNEGTLSIFNDGLAFAGALIIGDGVGTSDTVTLSSSTTAFAPTSDVTVNSSGRLNLAGTNTIDALVVNGGFVGGATSVLTVNSLSLTGGSVSVGILSGTIILNGNITTNAASNTANLHADVDLNGATRTINVADGSATEDLEMRDISNGGIIKTGAGTLLLAGVSTFAGGVSVSAGELAFGNNAGAGTGTIALGGATAIRADTSSRTVANAITVNGNITISGTVALTLSGAVNLTGNRTLTVNNTANTTISGIIGQNAAGRQLIKAGPGTLILSAANTFSGGLTLNEGTLAIGNAGAAGSGVLTLSGGTIRADTAAQTLSNAVTLAGDVAVGGTLDLTFAGTTTLTGNRTLTVSNTALTTFSGIIGQDVAGRSLTKAGPGTLVLSNANTFSGGLTLTAGTLGIGNDGLPALEFSG
jgi:fibronectin-binding autotransporter adhesin